MFDAPAQCGLKGAAEYEAMRGARLAKKLNWGVGRVWSCVLILSVHARTR